MRLTCSDDVGNVCRTSSAVSDRDAWDRLAAYEDTGLEPEEIERIVDSYGRGMTLRTENSELLDAIRGIDLARLRELAEADKDGRVLPEGCYFTVTDCGATCIVLGENYKADTRADAEKAMEGEK